MNNFSCLAESRIGVLTLSINDPNPFITLGFFMWRNNDHNIVSDRGEFIFKIDPSDIHYTSLIIFVVLSATAWLMWRCRKTVAAHSQCHANI